MLHYGDGVKTYLEIWIIKVWKAQDTDIDQVPLMVFVLRKEGLEAVDCGTGLGNQIRQNIDVNLGALKDVIVLHQFDKPCLNLFLIFWEREWCISIASHKT